MNAIVVDMSKEPVSAKEVSKQLAQMVVDLEDKIAKLDGCLKSVEKSLMLRQKRKGKDDDPTLRPIKKQKETVDDDANTGTESSLYPLSVSCLLLHLSRTKPLCKRANQAQQAQLLDH
jgi:hypothetical protein